MWEISNKYNNYDGTRREIPLRRREGGGQGTDRHPKNARKLYDVKPGDALLVVGDQRGMALLKTEIFQAAIDQAMEGLSK